MPASKVMIVEDEGLIADDIANELSLSGYEIAAVCASGEDALSSIQLTCPNLVLLDIKLSGRMDGIEAARRIHSDYDIPVIFLTSQADNETRLRAMREMPLGYVLKPFKTPALCSAIERALVQHNDKPTAGS